MGATVTGLVIHTGMMAAGRFRLKKVAKITARISCTPIVGVNAIKVPRPSPPAIALGVLRSLMIHLRTGRHRMKILRLGLFGWIFFMTDL
jgi:hypothetical protein